MSYILKTEFKNGVFFMYYESDGNIKVKRLPFRANQQQLIDCLDSIKKDSDYYIKEAEKYVRGDYNISPKKMVVDVND